jgi:hypothetical protein
LSGAADFAGQISGFYHKSGVDQLVLLAWYLEVREGKTTFDGEMLRKCFRDASLEPPAIAVYLQRLSAKKPPQLVKEKSGYRLAAAIRRDLDSRLGGNPATAMVMKALSDLPAKVPDVTERDFLNEALNCYRVKAYRASITMAWNLAYDHLVRWVLADAGRVAKFNAGLATKYPKKNLTIAILEDADALKESEFIEAARAGTLLDKNTTQILQEKLTKRNMAAHPSRVVISQSQADDAITDLVNNVVLKLS